jgi:hypothetical protein
MKSEMGKSKKISYDIEQWKVLTECVTPSLFSLNWEENLMRAGELQKE